MDFKIDWIAFTIPLPGVMSSGGVEAQAFILDRVHEFIGSAWQPIAPRHGWEVYQGRGFYQWVMHHPDTKLSLQWGDVNAHIHVECSGFSCRFIDTISRCEDFLQVVGTRASRIDIACDIETDIPPLEFTVNNEGKTVRSRGHIVSPDGETCYVGSRKNERYARVYRYHEPHPRAKYLRIETVMRGDYAKAAAARICEVGTVQAGIDSNRQYGWTHPVWDPPMASTGKITAPRSNNGEAASLRWLLETVAPALARAARDKLLDLNEYIEQKVKPLI